MAREVRQYKSEGAAILLAFFLGLIGLFGIGHIYVGRIGRGLVIFFVGLMLEVLAWFLILMCFVEGGPWIVLAIIVGLGDLAFWIWQIFDARAVCRQHNTELSRPLLPYTSPPGPYR